MKNLNRLLGSMDLQNIPLSVINLTTLLQMIAEIINQIPLGTTLGETNPILSILSPNRLVGRFRDKTLMRPISVPMDISNVLRQNEEKWDQIRKLYSSTVIPALLKNTKWYKNQNNEPTLDAIVCFKKRPSNFLPDWSLGKITKLHHSSDGNVRSVTIEYTSGVGDQEDITLEEFQEGKITRRSTTRDSNDIIILHPIEEKLNDDLKQVFHDLEELEKAASVPKAFSSAYHPDRKETLTLTSPTQSNTDSRVSRVKELHPTVEYTLRVVRADTPDCKPVATIHFALPNREILNTFISHHQSSDSLQTIITRLSWYGAHFKIANSGLPRVEANDKHKCMLKAKFTSTEETKGEESVITLSGLKGKHVVSRLDRNCDRNVLPTLDQSKLIGHLGSSNQHEEFPISEKIKWNNFLSKPHAFKEHGCSRFCCCHQHCRMLH